VTNVTSQPVYDNIFEYLYDNYEFKAPDNPLTRFYKKDIFENQYPGLDGEVNSEKQSFESPEEAVSLVKEFALAAGADLVGFIRVADSIVFEGIDVPHKWAVVMAMEMDFDLIETAPEAPSGTEVLHIYWKLGAVTVKVAEFIRDLGYPARGHHPRGSHGRGPTILHTRAAIEAGMGEAGRMGLLITKEFGPRVRVSTVTTDLELLQSEEIHFGVDEYCESCHLCQQACEGDAIPDEKKEERGFMKYTIDAYKCLPHFAEYDGCNLCVSKCAFNRRKQDLERFIEQIHQ
jgi:ferredoxin